MAYGGRGWEGLISNRRRFFLFVPKESRCAAVRPEPFPSAAGRNSLACWPSSTGSLNPSGEADVRHAQEPQAGNRPRADPLGKGLLPRRLLLEPFHTFVLAEGIFLACFAATVSARVDPAAVLDQNNLKFVAQNYSTFTLRPLRWLSGWGLPMSLRAVDFYIEKIYEAVVYPERWPEVARLVAEEVGGESSTVCWIDKRARSITRFDVNNIDPAAFSEYAQRFPNSDPRVLHGIVATPGTVFRDHEISADVHRQFADQYDFFERYRSYHSLILVAENAADFTAGLNIYRPKDKPPFEPNDALLIHVLAPHLRKAISLSRELEAKSRQAPAGNVDFLEALAAPGFLLDESGRTVGLNTAAERFMAKGDLLRLRQGRLIALDGRENTRLEALIERSLRADCRNRDIMPLKIGGREGGEFVLKVLPLPRADSGAAFRWDRHSPRVLLLVKPLRPAVNPGLVALLLGLTPAQAEIASQLAQGASPEEIARRRSVSLATVRTQLKAVYGQTGVAGQAQLVSLVLGTVQAASA